MDTELAKTFLQIVATGSFVQAANRLNVGQTTVSARVRTLEQQLGRPLFVRNKGGASLTPAGEQFLRYAPAFLQMWERARHQVAVPPGHRSVLAVGSEVTLWRPLLLDWVLWMRRTLSDVAVRVSIDVPQDLINQVASGMVDIAIMYAPQHRPGLKIDLLKDEELVLVSTEPDTKNPEDADYLRVDWGPEFSHHHDMSYPDLTPGLQVNFGPFALNCLLSTGGTGYFRMGAVESLIELGRLHLVPGAPHFSYPVYVVYSADADDGVVGPALAGLRTISAA